MLTLVTGGAGFIGSNIVEAILARGEHARALDNFATGRRENLGFVEDLPAEARGRFELVEGDLRNAEDCRCVLQGVTHVVHQGAIPSVARSIEDPVTSHQVNAGGTLNLLLAAREAGVRRFVYASSSSVYGDSPTLPKTEEMEPRPLSPYALTKLMGEHYCRLFATLYGIETVSLRYFNVFGPRQDPASEYSAVIPRFLSALLSGKAPIVHGDGTQSRDFTYVTNVVEANLAARTVPGLAGEVVNIACEQQTDLLGLLHLIARILGLDVDPVFEPARAGDVKHSLADISKARRLLGYRVHVDIEEGLRRTVDHFQQVLKRGKW